MKYIKAFNEGLLDQSELDNIRDICDGTLAYLFDEVNGSINIVPNNGKLYNYIEVKIVFSNFVSGTTWSRIEDYIMSLYQRLDNDYDVKPIVKLFTLDSDADKETKYYDLDNSKFTDILGIQNLSSLRIGGYLNKYDINKNLIYSVTLTIRDRFHKKSLTK